MTFNPNQFEVNANLRMSEDDTFTVHFQIRKIGQSSYTKWDTSDESVVEWAKERFQLLAAGTPDVVFRNSFYGSPTPYIVCVVTDEQAIALPSYEKGIVEVPPDLFHPAPDAKNVGTGTSYDYNWEHETSH
jgi:hypothetical protein